MLHNFGKCVIQMEPEEDEIMAKPREKLKKAYPRFLCHPEKIYVICGKLHCTAKKQPPLI